MKPLVSIVIPCYGGEAYLAQAIESCLAQTYANLEILVVDDASPDRCAEIAAQFCERSPAVKLIRRPENGGVSRAFNTGYSVARGVYFTRLAQDDVFREDAIELMVNYLQDHPELGLTYCDCEMVDPELKPLRRWVTGEPETALLEDNDLGLCVMWRREVWERVGSFDPEFDAAEDYEYWLRASKQFRFGKCEGQAPFYLRLHPEMGSTRLEVRQRLAVAKARCRHLLPETDHSRLMAAGYLEAAWACRNQDKPHLAWKYSCQALTLAPRSFRNWKALLGASARLVQALCASGKARREWLKRSPLT